MDGAARYGAFAVIPFPRRRDRKSRNNARRRARQERGRDSRPASFSFTASTSSLSLLSLSLLSPLLVHFPPSGPASYFIHLARGESASLLLFAQRQRRSCLQIDSEIEIKSRNGWGRREATNEIAPSNSGSSDFFVYYSNTARCPGHISALRVSLEVGRRQRNNK